MKRRSLLTSSLLFCAGLSMTVGCRDRSTPSKAPVPNPNGLKLGFSAWPGWFPWQVAQEKELFQQAKVEVNLQWFDNYLDSIAALNNGKLDANSQTLADTISSIATGKDLVVVLTNDNSTGNDKLIISEQIKSVKDLKGKKVAAKDDADTIMAKRAGVSMAEYKDYLDGTKIFSLEDNLEAFKSGKDNTYLPQAAAETSKFLFENGLVKTQVDLSKLFDDRFVKAYAAKAKVRSS